MKKLILGSIATLTLPLIAAASPAQIQPSFCGFFLDKKPLTVEINSDKTAVLTFDGKTYPLSVVEYRVDGIPHGYACDDSELCVTGIEYTFSGPAANFKIYDSWQGQSAEAYGKNDNIANFHTVTGTCE